MDKIIIAFSLFCGMFSSYASFFAPNFKAEYFQEYESELTKEKVKTQGFIDYSYPSNIRFEQSAPDRLTYVANANQSWLYTPPFIEGVPGDLITDPTGTKYPYGKLFDVLKAGLKSNKYYDVKKEKKGLRFIYKNKVGEKLGIKESFLVFSGKPQLKNLKVLSLTQLDNKKIVLNLVKFDDKAKFPKGHFYFKRPVVKKK